MQTQQLIAGRLVAGEGNAEAVLDSASGAQIVTVSVRRESAGGKTGDAFWSLIRELEVEVLPNTAGCHSVREAVTTAKLARELFDTPRIKLEVIADSETLQPLGFCLEVPQACGPLRRDDQHPLVVPRRRQLAVAIEQPFALKADANLALLRFQVAQGW